MKKYSDKIIRATKKSSEIIKNDGVVGFTKRSMKYAYFKKYPERKKRTAKDILFINGCGLPHPTRYRVDHQMEQLRSAGVTSDTVFYENLSLDQLKYYRGFVFFRCPVTPTVSEFIAQARHMNKTCFFDIDDLVIDTKYTNKIKHVASMNESDKNLYDDGVKRMGETLKLCDYAITTTEQLRDELDKYTKEVYINRNVASDEMAGRSIEALKTVEKDESRVVIGYFSGSITHNEDFELILPSLVKLLEKHDNLYIKIVGILDIPDELKPFEDRIIGVGFMDWRDMQAEVAKCDINLAPLTNSIFNKAKSENKWTEASLVKVVTVASNLGAFKKVIRHKQTGILVDDADWFKALDEIISNDKLRNKIAQATHKEVLANHTTVLTAGGLRDFILSKLARNVGIVVPTTDISGGVNVAVKHAEILRKHGWDVTILDDIDPRPYRESIKNYSYRKEIEGVNTITSHLTDLELHFDTLVATLWATVPTIKKYPKVKNRLYFVQSFETDFYKHGLGNPRFDANSTYYDESGSIRYITMSPWCKRWLKEKFDIDAGYAPNGIDLDLYPFKERKIGGNGKIKILIEGDSMSEYKNTDEAFRIVEKLDRDKFHISYLSYRKEPKDWYVVDRFYNRIPPKNVGEVYRSCDILIKTSLLESFSYPPLEMMATGGYVVVVSNDGNLEYIKDGINCLTYEAGDIDAGVAAVEKIVDSSELRIKIQLGGQETAKRYKWENIESNIASLYE